MANHERIFILGCIVFLSLIFTISYFTSKRNVPSKASTAVQKYFGGTSQEVSVYLITGEEKGPTLVIFGGIHGDEAAGYLTADRYMGLTLKRGTLVVVPRLNLPAVVKRTRHGITGDMNRLFHLPENSKSSPDSKVVDLAKHLIRSADYVLNLHQADGFYSPRWISRKRNPLKWGQCNVIDAPIFDLPNGEKLELSRFAVRIASRSNASIKDKRYYFLVNNTDTANSKSVHKEQRRSLTYYALYKQHKTALALEATKSCSLPQAVAFLTIAINSVIEESGIQTENLPSSDPAAIRAEIRGGKI